jgi:hypothetical protein
MVRKCGEGWKTVNSWPETDIEDVIKYPYYACHGDMCTRRASQQSTMAQQCSAVTKEIVIMPVWFHDMPLLNSAGAHESFPLRSIIEIVTDETYGWASRTETRLT